MNSKRVNRWIKGILSLLASLASSSLVFTSPWLSPIPSDQYYNQYHKHHHALMISWSPSSLMKIRGFFFRLTFFHSPPRGMVLTRSEELKETKFPGDIAYDSRNLGYGLLSHTCFPPYPHLRSIFSSSVSPFPPPLLLASIYLPLILHSPTYRS